MTGKIQGRAHGIVASALRKGILIKQPCVRCGALDVEAHHEDHSNPLNVIWLCRDHHMLRHRERGDFSRPPSTVALRRPIALTLPPELVDELDAIASAEDRTRVKTIEIACRQFVQAYRRRPAAA